MALAITVIVSVAIFFLLRSCLRRIASDRYRVTLPPSPRIFPEIPPSVSPRIFPEIPPSVIDLPLFLYSSISPRSSAVTDADCAVCLSKFQNTDLLRSLPLCCHAFHVECIDKWLCSNLSCPLCRSSVFPSDSDLKKIFPLKSSDSFITEIGTDPESVGDPRSYTIRSIEYYVEVPSEGGNAGRGYWQKAISWCRDLS